jgi:hypothetical protein
MSDSGGTVQTFTPPPQPNAASQDRGLTAADILGAPKTKPKPVEVPEWGGTVYVRVMSAGDNEAMSNGHRGSAVAKMLLMTLCDADGTLLFTVDQVPELDKLELPVAARLFTEAARLNGLSNEELEEAVASFGRAQESANSTE